MKSRDENTPFDINDLYLYFFMGFGLGIFAVKLYNHIFATHKRPILTISSTETTPDESKAPKIDVNNEIEQLLRDPISLEPLRNPVITRSGYTYEKDWITAWFQQHKTEPLDNTVLKDLTVTPNYALKSIISLLDENPNAFFVNTKPYKNKHISESKFSDKELIGQIKQISVMLAPLFAFIKKSSFLDNKLQNQQQKAKILLETLQLKLLISIIGSMYDEGIKKEMRTQILETIGVHFRIEKKGPYYDALLAVQSSICSAELPHHAITVRPSS